MSIGRSSAAVASLETDDAPRRVRRARHFTEIAARLGGIDVHRPHDFERRFLPHQANDRRSDRSHAKLQHANPFSHVLFPENYGNTYLNGFPERLQPESSAHL